MKPQRPYLLRALYEWIVASDEIPYVLVDATVEGVEVPEQHVEDGQILLNLGPNAVQNLVLEDEYVMCGGRFSGRHFDICVPMLAVLAIYAKDTGQGMVFPAEEQLTAAISPTSNVASSGEQGAQAGESEPGSNKPSLRLV